MTGVAVRQIAGYRLDALAGRGGMGVVYRATDLALERTVAVKVIAPALASDPTFRERFQREARLLAAIDHPHVIPFYEADEANGELFLSMRWVEGCNLADVIHDSGGLEPSRALSIVRQIAGALDAVHAHGLVHRDLKPANVLLEAGPDGEHVYLSDFGAGSQLDVPSDATGTGQWLGSVDYVAPETVAGHVADVRSDLYALGCVLFEALAAVPPFHRDTQLATLWAHQREPPPSVCARRPVLPAQVDAVLARALAKDPDVRYRSGERLAEAFSDALLVARGAETVAPPPADPVPSDPTSDVAGRWEEVLPAPAPDVPSAISLTGRASRRARAVAGLMRRSMRRTRLRALRRRVIAVLVLAGAALYLASQLAAAPGADPSRPPRSTGPVASALTHRVAPPETRRTAGHSPTSSHRRTGAHAEKRRRVKHAARRPAHASTAAAAQTQPSSTSTVSSSTGVPVSTYTPPANSTSSSGASTASAGGPSGGAPFGPGYPGK